MDTAWITASGVRRVILLEKEREARAFYPVDARGRLLRWSDKCSVRVFPRYASLHIIEQSVCPCPLTQDHISKCWVYRAPCRY